jgi:hypothetical protein
MARSAQPTTRRLLAREARWADPAAWLRVASGGGWPGDLLPIGVPRSWGAAVFALSAVFAGCVSLFSTNGLHRHWGMIAVCAYAAGLVAILAWRSRGLDLALLLAIGGALATPLSWNAATGRHQPEVGVIARSATRLVHHHSPYQSAAALASAHNVNLFNPYLPVMSLFGIPRALFGPGVLTDPRLWFALAFLAIFGLALAAAGARQVVRWTVLVAASPIIALELAVGGTDVPILALMCLGLALLWRRPRLVLAGLALGVASAAKATAWPAVCIAAIMVGVRDGARPALRFTGSAVVACAVLIGPVAALWPSALIENTILFPLGLSSMRSPAASPLPGHALAQTGYIGHIASVALLVLACVAVAAGVVLRPPRTVPAAALWLILGLSVMFTLAPATRYGYYIYPAGLLAWLGVSLLGPGRRNMPPGTGPPREIASQATLV